MCGPGGVRLRSPARASMRCKELRRGERACLNRLEGHNFGREGSIRLGGSAPRIAQWRLCPARAAPQLERGLQQRAPPSAPRQRRGRPPIILGLHSPGGRLGYVGGLRGLVEQLRPEPPPKEIASPLELLGGNACMARLAMKEHAWGQHEQFPTTELLLRGSTRRS